MAHSESNLAKIELAGKQVVVVGLGQTGVAVAKFAASRGANVVVTDSQSPASRSALSARRDELGSLASFELGGMRAATFTSADWVVMSPGVPELPEMAAARAQGVPVIAEIELAYRFFDPAADLIAITGTNGKSTTTALTGALCEASGRPTFCGGNLGNHPLIEAVDHRANRPGGLIVAEVAGFMLETCTSFRPKVAACLTITEDHLDRYGTMDVYAKMKTRLFEWQTAADIAIANANDSRVAAGARAGAASIRWFDSESTTQCGAHLSADGNEIILRLPNLVPERYQAADLPLIGRHNLENAMVAYMAARCCGVSAEAIVRGARSFVPQKHRMEHIGRKRCAGSDESIDYYDDSKGTNVAAVAASLRGFPKPVVLICGGVDKGGSYAPMFEAFKPVARGLVVIGEATSLITAAASESGFAEPIVTCESLAEAVSAATELARPGDAVVLSPACSSYDMFKNFGHRGMVFRDAVSAVGADRLDVQPCPQ